MEIVSEPEMNCAQEAQAYVKKLRTLLRYLGTCDGNMEQGSLRVDANVSLHRPGTPFGTRAEIKNVNSIRFLGQAIDYEISRQLEILESGGVVVQETRLFDPTKGETRSMRSKEDAMDYRYFPDPDLRPLVLRNERIEAIRASMPELPDAKKARFEQTYFLSPYDADILVSEIEIAAYYETVLAELKPREIKPREIKASETKAIETKAIETKASDEKTGDEKTGAKLDANWLIVEVFAAMNRDNKTQNLTLQTLPFPPKALAELVDLILDDTISGKIAKDVFLKMWESGTPPAEIVKSLGLMQISDASVLEATIDKVIAENAANVEAYKGGKVQLFGFFVGAVMKALQGKANPGMVNDLLKKKLG
jgi:aspartyl-tRNA(Asn)/glutamyl-tRNA(Gln) amidotransferase subunit B